MANFRHITVAGHPRERGLEHGRLLADQIAQTVDVYLRFLDRPRRRLTALADTYRGVIGAYAPDYAQEIEAIAQGAALAPWQIYLLNARTEVVNAGPECTALYFRRTRLLGQNWDWLAALEPLCVLLTIVRPDGHSILTFTEPGMLAKIGMNSRGLGVCLNILRQPHGSAGVPVHVVLRAMLDAASFWEARQAVARAGLDKASHILLGDAYGNCCGIELAPERACELTPTGDALMHTNHYLGMVCPEPDNPWSTSHARLDKAGALLGAHADHNAAAMRDILVDAGDGALSISVPYTERGDFQGLAAGTVATVIMDLPARLMHVSRGNDPGRAFEQNRL